MNRVHSGIRKILFRLNYLCVMYAVLILMAVIIVWSRPILIIPVLIMLAAIVSFTILFVRSQSAHNQIAPKRFQYMREIEGQMDDTVISAVQYNPLPLCMIGSDGTIVWANKNFRKLFPEDEDPENKDIYEVTGLRLFSMSNEELADTVVNLSAINRSFHVQSSESAEQAEEHRRIAEDPSQAEYAIRMFHWMDITELQQLRKTYRDEKDCVIHIKVDNLDDILDQAPDEVKSSLAGQIEQIIRTWAVKSRAAVIRMSKSRYTVICDQRALDNTEVKKFSIMDEVRALKTGTDIPASLSIGAGAYGRSLAQTDMFAQEALDLALGRGGDQAVVRKDTTLDYYGGQLQSAGRRNKGKSHIVAVALLEYIDQADRVFIMGHKNPDMDAFGAAIGVHHIARLRNKEKEVYIVIDTWDSVQIPYRLAVETGKYEFIKSEQALYIAMPDDLMIVVDTHRPALAQCGELAETINRTVIIDHHRRSPDVIKNAALMHIEPYASSACELVTEMLQYITTEKKGITEFEANVLLSGVVLDTKNYSVKTGVRTFEAASWLKRQGADPIAVRQYFRSDMESFQKKAEIIARAEKLPYKVAVSHIAEPYPNVSVLIAKAADDLLDIEGIKASFVLGVEISGRVRVSARSLGEVNVQLIMEKIGGGGNLTMAGAQLDVSLRDAKVQLIEAIDAYMADIEEKQKKAVQKQLRDTIRIPALINTKALEQEQKDDFTEIPEQPDRTEAEAESSDSGKRKDKKDKKEQSFENLTKGKGSIRGIPNIE